MCIRKVKFLILCLLLLLFVIAPLQAQTLSRWALGRPSLLVDLPGNPSAGNLNWSARPLYSFFPNSWIAEENGLRVEISRLHTNNTPEEILEEISQKIKVPLSVIRREEVSGRDSVSHIDSRIIVKVIGKDAEFFTGASWAIKVTFDGDTQLDTAYRIIDSIMVEREGTRKWTLRSLGKTSMIAELPYELLPNEKDTDTDLTYRYETNFDGLSVSVLDQSAEEGKYFDSDKTIKGLIDDNKNAPGITDFKSSYQKTKLGDKTADMITMDFKQGHRNYRIYQFAYIQRQRSILASVKIDPTRKDNQEAAEKILRSIRLSDVTIYGWTSYEVGKKGLFVDLPKPPPQPKQQNAVAVYNIESPLSNIEIREVEVGFPGGHSPDFAAKNYFDIQNAISTTKFELNGIEKLLIDGLEARLIKATWKNGNITNQRQILMVLGYETQWIIDVLAAPQTKDYMERVMQSVRIDVPSANHHVRQSFGKMGVSFLVDESEKKLDVKTTPKPNDPVFVSESMGFGHLGYVTVVFYEAISKSPMELSDELGKLMVNSFAEGYSESNGVNLTADLRDKFKVSIDGIEGLHLIFNFKSESISNGPPVQGDLIMLSQDTKTWCLLVITNYGDGKIALYDRGRILNSLRIGY